MATEGVKIVSRMYRHLYCGKTEENFCLDNYFYQFFFQFLIMICTMDMVENKWQSVVYTKPVKHLSRYICKVHHDFHAYCLSCAGVLLI